MAHIILSEMTASITELKQSPMATFNSAGGGSIAILSHNEPVFYCVPPTLYEAMMDIIEDVELAAIVRARQNDEEVEVNLDDLLK